MEAFELMPIEKLMRPEGFDCECGVHHAVSCKYLKIARGAIELLPEAVRACGGRKAFVVCDKNTYAAAGERALRVLARAGIESTLFMLSEHGYPKVEPDEYSLGSLAMRFDTSCDIIIAVGGGVINDLSKILAFVSNLPQIILGTAPSMDGFASNSSSMVVDNVKSTLYNRCPAGIVLDTEIMAQAPMRMLQAGFGDMIAKYISVCEWRISHVVNGEYYCEHVAALMRNALKKIMDSADGLAKRDPDSVGAVAEGLVLSGFAMSFAKVSRPASGLEHYFSHMWDMLALERGREADLHGIQVGVGTVLTMNIYEDIKTLKPSRAKAEKHMREFDTAAWEANIRRVFGKTAPQVLAIEETAGKNDPLKHAKRLNALIENWDVIQDIIRAELPDREWLFEKMRVLGMPMTPADIGINRQDTLDAFLCARDIRDKYLSASFLWDLGEIEEFAEKLRSK
ncbi:MAG: sn-glycerol-1-phosphate dehydrogenase [Clostridia bacterium]|nr:sn-glycerol-1-phosphate dehydrogenase [Clostridia bacterium]